MDFAQWPYECCWIGFGALDDFFIHVGIHPWDRDNVIFSVEFYCRVKGVCYVRIPRMGTCNKRLVLQE